MTKSFTTRLYGLQISLKVASVDFVTSLVNYGHADRKGENHYVKYTSTKQRWQFFLRYVQDTRLHYLIFSLQVPERPAKNENI